MQLFSNDLGLDLGTSNVLINVAHEGIVIHEPTVIAIDKNSGNVLQVGSAARNMLGRTPGNVVAMCPLRDGVISDHDMTVKMLQMLLRSVNKSSFFSPKPRVVVCVPSGVTNVEERTLINAVMEAGARRVYLIEEPLAAALGAGLDISGPKGHMVVDIGGGTTDIAVVAMHGVAVSSSLKTAGIAFDEAIARYIRSRYGVIIGRTTAEDIKIQIGCVLPRDEVAYIEVKGREAKTGVPRELRLNSGEILDILRRPARQIVEEVMSVLEDTTPELVADIAENGITLTGGGCQIWGMAELLSKHTGIACHIADDPASCVAYGCGKSLAWINQLPDGPINIARKRLLKGK